MAKQSATKNGHDRLEEAMAMLIQNQASFLGRASETQGRLVEIERHHTETERHMVEMERRHLEYQREAAERFARIEVKMADIFRILAEHGRLLERLPEAVREKIDFKSQ